MFDPKNKVGKISEFLEDAVKNKEYKIYKNDPEKEDLIKQFNCFLRDNKKVIFDVDKLMFDKVYKAYTYKLYFFDLIKNPSKFILYKEGYGWTTEYNTLLTWQLNSKRTFKTCMNALFTDLTKSQCFFCENPQVYYMCSSCSVFLCINCFDERTNFYFKHANIFKCRHCKEINVIS